MVIMNKAKYERACRRRRRPRSTGTAGEVFAKFFGQKFDENNDAVFQKAKKDKKRTITILTAEQQKPWKAAVQPAIEQWKKSTPDGEKLLKAFSDEIATIEAAKK